MYSPRPRPLFRPVIAKNVPTSEHIPMRHLRQTFGSKTFTLPQKLHITGTFTVFHDFSIVLLLLPIATQRIPHFSIIRLRNLPGGEAQRIQTLETKSSGLFFKLLWNNKKSFHLVWLRIFLSL